MQRFFKALSITAGLIVLQSTAQAQTAIDLINTEPVTEVSAIELPSSDNKLYNAPAFVPLGAETLALEEATISEDDIAPAVTVPREREWSVEVLPDFSPNSACAPRLGSITILCLIPRD